MKRLNERTIVTLLMILFVLLPFQQFPVIYLGGALKLYDIFLVFLFFLLPFYFVLNRYSIVFVFVFVFVPMLSVVVNYIYGLDYREYFEYFPEVEGGGRYSPVGSKIIVISYYMLIAAYLVFCSSIKIKKEYYISLLKLSVSVCFFVSLYSILKVVLNTIFQIEDLIQRLPYYFQNVAGINYGNRMSGFSQEPSFYVYYQAWSIVFLMSIKEYFSLEKYSLYLFVLVIVLLMTFSSTVLALLLSVLMVFSVKSRFGFIKGFFSALIFLIFIFSLSFVFDFSGFYYSFYQKISNFFSYPTHTLDSGSYRAYTSLIGFFIFIDNIMTGVGPGNVIFAMPVYESFVGIKSYGESLNPGSFPQSLYLYIMAELGLVGVSAYICMFMILGVSLFRESDRMSFFLLIGLGFTLISFASLAPAYSFFIWAYIGIVIVYLRSNRGWDEKFID